MKQRPDYGPGERLKKGGVILEPVMATDEEKAGFGKRARVESLTALDWYHRRGYLAIDVPVQEFEKRAKKKNDLYRTKRDDENHRRYEAGSQLGKAWQAMGLEPHVISKYSDMVSSGSIQGVWVVKADAHKKWREAVQYVGLVSLNDLIEVCCIGNRVKTGRMAILREGLRVLANHYKL